MQYTCLIYESKNGTTEELVKKIALILGPSQYCRTADFQSQYENCDFFVIVSPIYGEQPDERIMNFIEINRHWLKNKKVAMICNSPTESPEEKYIESIQKALGNSLLWIKILSGKTDIEQIVGTALEIKAIKDMGSSVMPQEKLQPVVESFLLSHDTCTLCTGYENGVRATPIEYHYHDGHLYILSEGGIKFANILLNNQVSVAIYENFTNMNELKGMTLTGEAQLIDYGSEAYCNALKKRGLNPEKILAMPFILNVFKIKLQKAEVLLSVLKDRGYDVKQIYCFK